MLLFGVWEGRNGARPRDVERARLPARRGGRRPTYLASSPSATASSRPTTGRIALTGGSDDHGALDIATTWTDAPGDHGSRVPRRRQAAARARRRRARLDAEARARGRGAVRRTPTGVGRRSCRTRPRAGRGPLRSRRRRRRTHATARSPTSARGSCACSESAPAPAAIAFSALPAPGAGWRARVRGRAADPVSRHRPPSRRHPRRAGRRSSAASSASAHGAVEPRALVFTDTFSEANGVAGTMRRLAAAAADGTLRRRGRRRARTNPHLARRACRCRRTGRCRCRRTSRSISASRCRPTCSSASRRSGRT